MRSEIWLQKIYAAREILTALKASTKSMTSSCEPSPLARLCGVSSVSHRNVWCAGRHQRQARGKAYIKLVPPAQIERIQDGDDRPRPRRVVVDRDRRGDSALRIHVDSVQNARPAFDCRGGGGRDVLK